MANDIVTQIFDFLGLSTPFLYASTTATFFTFADKRTSKEAKEAIDKWMKPTGLDAPAVSNALVQLFDRVYGKDLLSLRAFGISALISLVVTAIYILELKLTVRMWNQKFDFDYFLNWMLPVLFNVLGAYVALFIIRKWLLQPGFSPFTTLVIGSLIGMGVVVVFSAIRAVVTGALLIVGLLIEAQTTNLTMTAPQYWYVFRLIFDDYWKKGDWLELLPPALAVQTWLLLIVIAVTAIRLFNPLVRTIGMVQWLLADGKGRPIKVIGYIAAVIVFIGSAAIIHLKTVLS